MMSIPFKRDATLGKFALSFQATHQHQQLHQALHCEGDSMKRSREPDLAPPEDAVIKRGKVSIRMIDYARQR